MSSREIPPRYVPGMACGTPKGTTGGRETGPTGRASRGSGTHATGPLGDGDAGVQGTGEWTSIVWGRREYAHPVRCATTVWFESYVEHASSCPQGMACSLHDRELRRRAATTGQERLGLARTREYTVGQSTARTGRKVPHEEEQEEA